jgi:hypothetical protein
MTFTGDKHLMEILMDRAETVCYPETDNATQKVKDGKW